MKDILENEEKTNQKKAELEEILKQYTELITVYKTKIEEMLRWLYERYGKNWSNRTYGIAARQ